MTKEFQDHCARLALGRTSAPSSAPTDTRIPVRPSSGAGSRVSVAVGTEPISRPTRPVTAPSRHQSNGDVENNKQTDSCVSSLERSATTMDGSKQIKAAALGGKSQQNEAETETSESIVASKIFTDQPKNSVLDDSYMPRFDKVAKPKLVNQGIGMPGLQREFTMVEMPISTKMQDNVKLERAKTTIIDRADQKVKQSEKNVAARKSRLDTLIEQTVELVQDALDLEDGQAPSEFSSAVDLKAKARPVRRTRSEDARERSVRVENSSQRSVRSGDPRQATIRGQPGLEYHRRKVDQFREKLRQHTRRKVEKQEKETRVRRPVRKMVWNQNPGQPYVADLQERMRKEQKLRRDTRQSSAPVIVIPDPSDQQRSELQRAKDPRMAYNLESIKEQAKLRRSYSDRNEDSRHSSSKSNRQWHEETRHGLDPKLAHNLELIREQARVRRSQSLNRDRNVDSRHSSSKSERSRQQECHESRIGSSKSVAGHYNQDSDKSKPLVMFVEGDDPSAYRHVKLDMSKTSRSMDIANGIDFSGKASKLRDSPYLQYNPLIMGKPRKQRSASLNRSQQR